MTKRNLHSEAGIKKQIQHCEEYKLLLQEIENLRYQLNKEVIMNHGGINDKEVLKLSEKLDELIAEYLMNKK